MDVAAKNLDSNDRFNDDDEHIDFDFLAIHPFVLNMSFSFKYNKVQPKGFKSELFDLIVWQYAASKYFLAIHRKHCQV